jgi:molecular chaperone DnaK (HSP70)
LGEELGVVDVVLTVPAWFDVVQLRAALFEVVACAGMRLIRVIHAPDAAAIAYCLDNMATSQEGAKDVLIFDLGGGTLDVSLVCLEEDIVEVKAMAGDARLGGDDFEQLMVDHSVAELQPGARQQVLGSPRALRRLCAACEAAKRTLSSAVEATIEVDALLDGLDFRLVLTRARFEELNANFFRRCLEPVEKLLRDTKMDKADVREIVLIGGSTRIPKVQQLLSAYFNGKGLCRSVNPDEAALRGAAMLAASLTFDEKLLEKVPPHLMSVTPMSIGIETAGSIMTVLVQRNTLVPTRKECVFSTSAADDQTVVVFRIFQGERSRTYDNWLLAELELCNVTPAPRGTPQFRVEIDIDSSFFVHVNATELSTGKKASWCSSDPVATGTKQRAGNWMVIPCPPEPPAPEPPALEVAAQEAAAPEAAAPEAAADAADATGARAAAQGVPPVLVAWLASLQLEEYAPKLQEQLGLKSPADAALLCDGDDALLEQKCGMKLLERRKLLRAAKQLAEEAAAAAAAPAARPLSEPR